MFELGIRLAFDKPTVIVKDDQTKYPFDTGPIEYVSYRRDLRFASVVDFKATLSKKLSATLSNSKNEGYTSFLRSFGEFTIAKIEAREIPQFDFLVAEIRNLRSLIVANSRASESKSPWEDSDPIQVFFHFRKRVEFAVSDTILVDIVTLQSLLSEAERLYPLLASNIHHDECRQIAEFLRMMIKRKESQ